MVVLGIMNTLYIVLGVVVALIIGAGVYWYMEGSAASEGPASSQQETAAPQVQAQDVTVGTGKEAAPGSRVSILYVGQLQDGTVFDSSAAHNNEPLVFTLGEPGIVPGFQIGVNGMKEGGERNIVIPPELGYGGTDIKDPQGKVIIPANSSLIFGIRLVKVENATGTPAR